MKIPVGTLLTLAIAAPLQADVLILKDGSKVEWKSLRDQGESYEIETVQGTRITVRKERVEKFEKSSPPLTGATFTFDKNRTLTTIEILRILELKSSYHTGNWKSNKEVAIGSSNSIGKLDLGLIPPEEYDLTVIAQKQDESHGEFFVGLVGGGKQFSFHFNAYAGCWTGYSMIDGKHVKPHGLPKAAIKDKTHHKIVFMVRKEGVSTYMDGDELLTWGGDWKRVSLLQELSIPDASRLFIGVVGSSYRFQGLTLSYPKEK